MPPCFLSELLTSELLPTRATGCVSFFVKVTSEFCGKVVFESLFKYQKSVIASRPPSFPS